MGKFKKPRRSADEIGPASTAQAASSARAVTSGIVFNKEFGQHILKNPLVAQGIVDKVGKRYCLLFRLC
jgi:18S rRNA (adenine1779-N6/adenine1780-N6)-dimethyltransferase